MDENLAMVQLVKTVSFFIGLGGTILGFDAILGAHLISAVNHFLSKTIDLDRFIMAHPKRRIGLGVIFVVASLAALFLVRV